MSTPSLPIALTIAGSDSGGGAGIQADLKTFHQFGVFGTSAVTAITAQNTLGVQAIHPIPVETVRAQIDAIAQDLRPAGLKSGMLATKELVEVIAQAIQEYGLDRYVMDPVMVATSGDRLLDQDAEAALTSSLLPLATLVTPNLREARILTGLPIRDQAGMREAARALVDMGAGAALIKGGHLEEGEITDLLYDGLAEYSWSRPRIDTDQTHGTGCTLSAAVAACLARGMELAQAVDLGVDFIARAIAQAPGLGQGNGPVNHFVASEPGQS